MVATTSSPPIDILRKDFRRSMTRFGIPADPLADNLLAPRRVHKIQAPLSLMGPDGGDAPVQGYVIETPDGYAMQVPETYNRQQIGAISNYNQQLGNIVQYEAFAGRGEAPKRPLGYNFAAGGQDSYQSKSCSCY